MNLRIIALIILTLLTSVSAHAASYNFSDNAPFTTADYTYNSGQPADIVTRTQNISGTTGTISDLNVTLQGINSTAIMDMTFILVGPNNTGVVLASHAGGGSGNWSNSPAELNNVDLSFDDSATSKIVESTSLYNALTTQVTTGSYQTSAYLEVPKWHQRYAKSTALLNPVESGIFAGVNFSDENLLSAFNDISANGSWNLLAYDNLADNKTTVNGWSLNFTTSTATSGAVPEPAEWVLLGFCICGILTLKLRSNKLGLKV